MSSARTVTSYMPTFSASTSETIVYVPGLGSSEYSRSPSTGSVTDSILSLGSNSEPRGISATGLVNVMAGYFVSSTLNVTGTVFFTDSLNLVNSSTVKFTSCSPALSVSIVPSAVTFSGRSRISSMPISSPYSMGAVSPGSYVIDA